MSVDGPAAVALSSFVGCVKEVLVLTGCGLLAKSNLDTAGERLQKALEQLQTAGRELSGSTQELTALRDER